LSFGPVRRGALKSIYGVVEILRRPAKMGDTLFTVPRRVFALGARERKENE